MTHNPPNPYNRNMQQAITFPQKGQHAFYRFLMRYSIIAALSMYTTLFVNYVGEEGVYTVSTLEMWYNHNYLINTLFGTFYGRPGMMNWLMIPLAQLVGWQHVLVVSRFVSATASIFIGINLAWLTQRLTKDKPFTALAVALFFTGDLLFRHGWLSYADPLFSMYVFASMSFLWIAVKERRYTFLLMALFAMTGAFLTKAITAYAFYGIAAFIFFIRSKNRFFLLSPLSILLHALALAFPIAWFAYASPDYFSMMGNDLFTLAFAPPLGEYIWQVLFTQPLLLLMHLAPISLVVLYVIIKKRQQIQNRGEYYTVFLTALIIAASVFIPCWFAPKWPEARYYMPVYPFMALCLAYIVWHLDTKLQTLCLKLLVLTIVLKLIAGFWFFPFFQSHLRDNFHVMANDIIKITKNAPIYVNPPTAVATTESLVSVIDMQRLPAPPLQLLPKAMKQGYIISERNTPQLGKLVYHTTHQRRPIYLFCRGQTC